MAEAVARIQYGQGDNTAISSGEGKHGYAGGVGAIVGPFTAEQTCRPNRAQRGHPSVNQFWSTYGFTGQYGGLDAFLAQRRRRPQSWQE